MTKFEVLLLLVLLFLMTLMIMIFLLAMMMIVILLMMMMRISEANKHKGAASGRAANQGDNEDGHHT